MCNFFETSIYLWDIDILKKLAKLHGYNSKLTLLCLLCYGTVLIYYYPLPIHNEKLFLLNVLLLCNYVTYYINIYIISN